MERIPFSKPFLVGNETRFIKQAVESYQISGNGKYTRLCHQFFENQYGFKKCLLTSSCTDALEMTAILANIQYGDEVIMPTYTFVSTANAFILRGAKIIFVDSREDHPGIDEGKIEEVITEKTKAIVPVHYAGLACDMDMILAIARKHNILVIEDAAQAVDNYYKGKDGVTKALGSFGHLATFSFHETKNIISGEGGMLVVNDEKFIKRSEIIWEKGTNRSAFWRGEVDKYNWVDIGSSFLPSEITAAFLCAQLEELENIQNKRKEIWNQYDDGLTILKNNGVGLPNLPKYATNNAHIFYLVCRSSDERTQLIKYLKHSNIDAFFHYICLHNSPYFEEKHDGRKMPNAKRYEECLVRLPLWVNMSKKEVNYVIQKVLEFYKIGSIKVN